MSPELINTIGTIAGVIVAALGAFLFAFWIAMGIWTFHDIRQRTRDWLVIILAVALVLIFPLDWPHSLHDDSPQGYAGRGL